MLSQLKNYLIQSGQEVSLYHLSEKFNAAPSALRPMLNVWIDKGKVTEIFKTPQCGVSCSSCNVELITMFKWV